MSATALSLDRDDVKDIIRRLKQLDEYVQKKVSRDAAKAMSKDVVVYAAPAAPVRSGNLRRSLKIMTVKKIGTFISGRVAFSRGSKKDKDGKDVDASAPYAMFLEFGSRSYRKKVHNRRRSKHRDLWKSWWKANLRRHERLFISEIDLQMDKTLRLMAKRSAAAHRR